MKKKKTPGVIFKQSFVLSDSTGSSFSGYLDYMNRPQAFDKEKYQDDSLYKNYLGYMDSREKSDGLFDINSDRLDEMQKENYQKLYDESQAKGCPMYQGVISFDNDFLREHGLMAGEEKLDKRRLKEIARQGMTAMLEASHLDITNTVWTAAIHTNTDNIHIHFSLIEKEKVKRRFDKIEVEAFDKLKSKAANLIIGDKKVREISALYRDALIPGLREQMRAGNIPAEELIKQLPDNIPWEYNRESFAPYRQLVRGCIDKMIQSDPQTAEDFKKFNAALDSYSTDLMRLYGQGNRKLWERYKGNKLEDFYARAGNSLLKSLRGIADNGDSTGQDCREWQKKTDARFRQYQSSPQAEKMQNLQSYLKTRRTFLAGISAAQRRALKDYRRHLKKLRDEFELEQDRASAQSVGYSKEY